MIHNNFLNRFKNIGFFHKPGLTVGFVVVLSMWLGASAMSSLESYVSEGTESWYAYSERDAKAREKALKEAARQREKDLRAAAKAREKAQKAAAKAREKAQKAAAKAREKAQEAAAKAHEKAQKEAARQREEIYRTRKKFLQKRDRLRDAVPSGIGIFTQPLEVAVDKFDRVVVYDCIDVIYQQGASPGKVEIISDNNDDTAVMVSVVDGELKVTDRGTGRNNLQKIIVKITSAALSEVRLYGVSTFTTNGSLKVSDTLFVETNDASRANFGEITGKALDFRSDGASDIYVLAADVESVKLLADASSNMRIKVVNAASVRACAEAAANIILGGRCDSLSVEEDSNGIVRTKGLIIQGCSFPLKDMPKDNLVAPTAL